MAATVNGSANLTNSVGKHDKLNGSIDSGNLNSTDPEEVVAIVPNGITPGQNGAEVVILPVDNAATPGNALHPSYPASNLELPDHHIDEVRSLRVTVIGAGLSGILAGILLPAKVPNIQLTILEKNTDVVSDNHPQALPPTLLNHHPGRHLVGKCLSWSEMRHTSSRLPSDIQPQYSMVATIRRRPRDP